MFEKTWYWSSPYPLDRSPDLVPDSIAVQFPFLLGRLWLKDEHPRGEHQSEGPQQPPDQLVRFHACP